MQERVYTFSAEHIGLHFKDSILHVTDHHTQQTFGIRVRVDDKQLPQLNYQALSPLLADLIDLAFSVHLVDRLAKNHQKLPEAIAGMPRMIHLRIPLREKERLNTPSITEKLQQILYWFTGDYWFFDFQSYTKHGRDTEVGRLFSDEYPYISSARVALWSGGLDAFAGAYQQLWQDNTSNYLLFGTGSSTYMHSRQNETADMLASLFSGRAHLVQLPFSFKGTNGAVSTNADMRSRGFVFLLMGAVCALHIGKDTLYIHENGIGAINLPYRKSEVGLDHSRSVHPLSLVSMSDLLSTVLEKPFFFKNPFLTWTKAQMCKELLSRGAARQAFFTVSCDSRHRADPTQCGYCSSCLLRRQAIAVSGIPDGTGYQITNNPKRTRKPEDATHYRAMLAQVDTMKTLLAASDPWQKMSQRYLMLQDIVENTDVQRDTGFSEAALQTQLLQLYQNYVDEWEQVREPLGRAFLE